MTGGQNHRADARLWLVVKSKRPQRRVSLPTWCEAYNKGEFDAPDWVRALVPTISVRGLVRWRNRFKKDASAGLEDRYGNRQGTGIIDSDPELAQCIIAQILYRPHANAKHIQRTLEARFGDDRTLPGLDATRKWIARYKRDNARLLSAVTDPDRHRSQRMPAGGDAAAGIVRANQLWELDSTPADVICTDGRHAIIGAIDVFSRRAMVVVAPTSRATAICALLRRCLLDWGVPETVRTDEGSDYTSIHVTRVLADLEIHHDALPPYQPQRKPFIERFFGTLSRGLFEQLPGYCGHSVADARAIQARKSFAARRGDGRDETFEVALSAAELQAVCDDWLKYVYEREPHKGLGGRTPWQMALGQPITVIENERALDNLLAEAPVGHGRRKVQKKGLQVEHTWFIADRLGPLVGEWVKVRFDPADAGRVYVFDAAGAFVVVAEAPERTGIDRAEVATKMKALARAADAEGRAHARDLKRRVTPETAIDEILAAARRLHDHNNVVALLPPPAAHESTDLDETASAADAPPAFGDAPVPLDASERRRRADGWAKVMAALDASRGGKDTA